MLTISRFLRGSPQCWGFKLLLAITALVASTGWIASSWAKEPNGARHSLFKSEEETVDVDEQSDADVTPAGDDDADTATDEFQSTEFAEPQVRPSGARSTSSGAETITPTFMVENGFGFISRGSFLAGRTFGRTDSIAPLEVMPYILTDEHFVFADLRGFITTRSQPGGNFGLGYRRLMDDWNAWAGASVWYDADQSTTRMFQQVGVSLEALVQGFEVRSNLYMPLTSNQMLANSVGGTEIVGNQLLFSRGTTAATALRGVDAEVGYSWPILDHHVVRGFVGGYHFEGGSSGGVNGFKARVEGVVNNAVTAQLLYTHDKLYGDNVMAGVSFQFPFGSQHPTSGWTRNTPSPFRYVERNYNVIVDQSSSFVGNQVATDPSTGNPYIIEQVNSQSTAGGTPDGTAAHPFTSLAAAQAAGGNVILVQSGSVLTDPITLGAGQHVFGQNGSALYLPTTGGSLVRMPELVGTSGNSIVAPIIQNVNGDAVTLASNSELAGFTISNPTGDGVVGNNVSGVSLHDLIFNSIGGDAVQLNNSTGNIALSHLQINSAVGDGIAFNGGTPNIQYSGQGATLTSTGNGFSLRNLTGGSANLSGLTMSQVGGMGLLLDTVASNVTVDSLSITGSGGNLPAAPAVSIVGNTGTSPTYQFTGTTRIDSPHGAGFTANGTDAVINVSNLTVNSTATSPAVSLANLTNSVTMGALNVTSQNATGLFADNDSNLRISLGSITTVNAAAVDVTDSTIHANFGQISANGGAYGIRLNQSTGDFTLQGSPGAAGTIQNMTGAGVQVNTFGTVNIGGLTLLNNAVGIQSATTSSLTLSGIKVTGSTGYAIDSLDDHAFTLTTSTFDNNGAAGGGTIRLQADTGGTFTPVFQSNTITDHLGTAVQLLTQPGGAGSTLNARFTANSINGYGNNGSLINVNWDGPATVVAANNSLSGYGNNMTGIMVQDPSTTGTLNTTISSNTISFLKTTTSTPAAGTGIWIIDGQSGATGGNSNVSISSNQIVFQGLGGTGLRYGLYGANWSVVSSNTMTDQAGGATGMLYDYASSDSILSVTANSMVMVLGDTNTNHGVIFTQVGQGVQLATQSGATSNFVYYPSSLQTLFSAPSTGIVGGMLINNAVYK